MATYNAGADIDAFCSKCQLVLAHVIIAVKEGRPARVECKTCNSVHAYRAGPRAASKSRSSSSSSSKRSSKSKGVLAASDYDRLIEGRDLSRAQRYATTTTFEANEVINHKSFGLGVVTRLLSDSKMEVLFPAGLKVLVHSR